MSRGHLPRQRPEARLPVECELGAIIVGTIKKSAGLLRDIAAWSTSE